MRRCSLKKKREEEREHLLTHQPKQQLEQLKLRSDPIRQQQQQQLVRKKSKVSTARQKVKATTERRKIEGTTFGKKWIKKVETLAGDKNCVTFNPTVRDRGVCGNFLQNPPTKGNQKNKGGEGSDGRKRIKCQCPNLEQV